MPRQRIGFAPRIKRLSTIAAMVTMATGIATLAGQSPAQGTVTVTAVTGRACGYQTNLGIGGGPLVKQGCVQVNQPAGSLSPSVTLPSPAGSSTAVSAVDSDGARALAGPAAIFGGRWPENIASGPPSGPISVRTQGTPAGVNAGGLVTSSADITLHPTPISVPCFTGYTPPCLSVGGFGPFPVEGDSLHVECNARHDGASGFTRFVNADLATSTTPDGLPADLESVPDNPPVNYTRSGVHNGEAFTVVYNQQIVNPDGSLTVNAVHLYRFGSYLMLGEVIIGQVTCGTSPSPLPPDDGRAPTCGIRVVEIVGGGDPTPKVPREETAGVFDTTGLQSITNISATNATVQVGEPTSTEQYMRFTQGQTGPLFVTATRINELQPMSWSFTATDTMGNVTHCGPRLHPPADFDGDGTTDVSVFRPSTGQWFVENQPTVFFGTAGDIPVSCDYDGNGTTDIAVFRPSVGGWYVRNQPAVFHGLNGDVPVPGDYDGNGTCNIAVFRPSVGGWYIQGQPTVFHGLNGDIPVPADYDGNGMTDRAVFRPSVGGWYRTGAPTVFFGLNGDIPVPNDYDGNGTIDNAIFRPSVGGWYVAGQSPMFLGLGGDIPVPGSYHLNGDRGVFRPSGAWFIQGLDPIFFGTNGDVPLPLPAAIRRAFFP